MNATNRKGKKLARTGGSRLPIHIVRRPVIRFKKQYLPQNFQERLEEEARLIASDHGEWRPADDSLRTWYASLVVASRGEKVPAAFELIIPNGYPRSAPVVRVLSPVRHYTVRRGGYIYLPVLRQWNGQCHLVDIIKELKEAVSRDHYHVTPEPCSNYQGITLPRSRVLALEQSQLTIGTVDVETDESLEATSQDFITLYEREGGIEEEHHARSLPGDSQQPEMTSLHSSRLDDLVENTVSSITTRFEERVLDNTVNDPAGISMFSLGVSLTTLSDWAELRWLRKANFISVLTEIKVMAEALNLKGLVHEVVEEMNHLNGLKSLNEEFYSRIKTKTAEWSARIKHGGTGENWIAGQPTDQVQLD